MHVKAGIHVFLSNYMIWMLFSILSPFADHQRANDSWSTAVMHYDCCCYKNVNIENRRTQCSDMTWHNLCTVYPTSTQGGRAWFSCWSRHRHWDHQWYIKLFTRPQILFKSVLITKMILLMVGEKRFLPTLRSKFDKLDNLRKLRYPVKKQIFGRWIV